jgi:hypothetical protein
LLSLSIKNSFPNGKFIVPIILGKIETGSDLLQTVVKAALSPVDSSRVSGGREFLRMGDNRA